MIAKAYYITNSVIIYDLVTSAGFHANWWLPLEVQTWRDVVHLHLFISHRTWDSTWQSLLTGTLHDSSFAAVCPICFTVVVPKKVLPGLALLVSSGDLLLTKTQILRCWPRPIESGTLEVKPSFLSYYSKSYKCCWCMLLYFILFFCMLKFDDLQLKL